MTLLAGLQQGDDELLTHGDELLIILQSPMTTTMTPVVNNKVDDDQSGDGRRRRRPLGRSKMRARRPQDDSKSSYNGEQREDHRHSCKRRYTYIILAIYSRNHSYCSCTWIPESYVAPAVQFCGIMLVGTNHFWLPPFGSLLLNSILMDRGPLGGETAAHTAPRVRLRSWHVRFTVCIQPSTGI